VHFKTVLFDQNKKDKLMVFTLKIEVTDGA